MALRKILTMDQPVLRAKAKKVSRFDNFLERLVNDMWETMREAPGVGLAAPQIGQSIRVLVAEYEENAVALVNPEILKRSDEVEYGTEGCLSIPGLVGDDVPRHIAITVKGRDPKGKQIRLKAEGWWARVLQHEMDHLDGVLYIDHIPPEKVRKVEPDEIADEAEVRHVRITETVAGESEPIRRSAPAAISDSGKNGNRDSEQIANRGKNGNSAHSPRPAGDTPASIEAPPDAPGAGGAAERTRSVAAGREAKSNRGKNGNRRTAGTVGERA
ncbi:MAG TPA: peptide deformylase [Ktedonobacterales bacterium]|nr:peptide deformylase [Ktedonobacterales bacterium]